VGGNAVSVIGDSSTDPVQPTNPVAPTEPTDPTGPTTPADPTDPEGAGTVVDPASWVSFGTASQKVATLVAASPAATTLAQTGAPSALLVGVGLLLLLAGGLLTRTGRRVAATG
jgi:LPXTG-motif cell wall-anchored protein